MTETAVVQEKSTEKKTRRCEECGCPIERHDDEFVCLACGLVQKQSKAAPFIPAGKDPERYGRRPSHTLLFDKGKGTQTDKKLANKIMNTAYGGRFNLSDSQRERIIHSRAESQLNRLMSTREYPNDHAARELLSKHNRQVLKLPTPELGMLTNLVIQAVSSIGPCPRRSIKAIINGVLAAYKFPQRAWIGMDAYEDETTEVREVKEVEMEGGA